VNLGITTLLLRTFGDIVDGGPLSGAEVGRRSIRRVVMTKRPIPVSNAAPLVRNFVDGLGSAAELAVLLFTKISVELENKTEENDTRTLTGEFPPGAEPRTVKMIAESLFFLLSLTKVIRPKRTNCAAISAASSLPTTDVKSQSHSSAVTAAKQYL